MKNVKRALLIAPVLVVIFVVGLLVAFNAGLFHDYVEKEVRSALGPEANVHLGPMQLMYRWPPLVRIGPSVVDLPAANLQWQNLEIEVAKIRAPYAVSLNLNQPHVILKPAPNNPPPKTAAAEAGRGGASKPPALSLKIQTVDGEIKTDFADVQKINLLFEQKLLMKTPASVHLSAAIRAKLFPVDLPLRADTDKLTFSEQAVKTSDLSLSLGGLSSSVQGTSLLQEGRHRWVIQILAKDLAQLPQPPMESIPAKKWRGEVQLKAEVNKDGNDKPWAAEGSFLAKNVGADVMFKQDKLSVAGPFQLEAEGKFSYLNERASLPTLKASADLSQAAVRYEEMLDKAAGVPMTASINAEGNAQKLNVHELAFVLWNFAGKVTGNLDLKAPFPADMQFSLKPASLAGSEKLLMPLRASPVQGELGLNGTLQGPLADPMKARVVIESLGLKKFSGVVNFEREGLAKIRGPVSVDVQGKGEFAGGQVKSAEGRGFADFSAAALVAGPLRKEEKSEFKMRFGVRNAGNSVLIDEMNLTSFVGNLSMKGKVDSSTAPIVDLNLEAKPVSLSEMRIAMPAFRDVIPKGSVNGRWQVRGKVEMNKPWHDWPVTATGNVDVRIPEYKILPTATAPAPVSKGPGTAPVKDEAFLPDGQLTRSARITLKVQVDQFVKEALVAKAVGVDGVFAGGKFSGNVNVGQVFGGSVALKNLIVPMLTVKPKIQGNVAWSNLVIEDAIAFAKPEYKSFAAGRTAGTAEFSTVMPAQADFMTQLRLRGDANAQPVVFNSVKVGEMVNAQLAKIPQLNLKPMKVDPLRGQAKAQFDLHDGVVELPNFQGTDVDNSEIQMKGKVILESMQGDFAGTFFWNDPPIKGCALEGNADAKGRMVVPVALKGNLMQPGFSLLSDVIGKLAAKTAECEGKKLVDKFKADGKQKLEKELKKTLKGLLGN